MLKTSHSTLYINFILMKNTKRKAFVLAILITVAYNAIGQNPVNWSKSQLMEPAQLAAAVQSKQDVPVIISVGPGAVIPGSIDVGSVQEQANLDKLAAKLKAIDKAQKVVVYCGCCPFEYCPNIRPTIALLKKMNFTDFMLLNLPKNIKTDWIDKGYPTSKL